MIPLRRRELNGSCHQNILWMPRVAEGDMLEFYEFFAGGGMVRAGLGDAAWQCRFANDFDHKKSAVYRRNWGDGILKTADVRRVTIEDLPGVLISHGLHSRAKTFRLPAETPV